MLKALARPGTSERAGPEGQRLEVGLHQRHTWRRLMGQAEHRERSINADDRTAELIEVETWSAPEIGADAALLNVGREGGSKLGLEGPSAAQVALGLPLVHIDGGRFHGRRV